jgi:hypothetical protein
MTFGCCAALGLTTPGCSGDDDSAPAPQPAAHIEIQGTWGNSAFGETDVIDDKTWSTDYGGPATMLSIDEYSNSERYAIRKAPDDAAFNPGTFDRVVWTKPAGGEFYYCTVTYGCATAALTETGEHKTNDGAGGASGGDGAAGAGGAGSGEGEPMTCQLSAIDASDPENGGCGDFPWTKLTAK